MYKTSYQPNSIGSWFESKRTKPNTSLKYIGSCLKYIGNMQNRIPGNTIGSWFDKHHTSYQPNAIGSWFDKRTQPHTRLIL